MGWDHLGWARGKSDLGFDTICRYPFYDGFCGKSRGGGGGLVMSGLGHRVDGCFRVRFAWEA